MTSKNKIPTEELAEKILLSKRAYYAGSPSISDSEYDQLEAELRKIAPDHPVLTLVGTDQPPAETEKVSHEPPMLSLEKTYSKESLISWAAGREIVHFSRVASILQPLDRQK